MDYKKKTKKRRLSFEQKYIIVQDVLEKGRHKKDVTAKYQIHVNSISNWIRTYKTEGVDGLRPFSRKRKVPEKKWSRSWSDFKKSKINIMST